MVYMIWVTVTLVVSFVDVSVSFCQVDVKLDFLLSVSFILVLFDFFTGNTFPMYWPRKGIWLNRILTSSLYFGVKMRKITGLMIPTDQLKNLPTMLKIGRVIRALLSI